MCAIREFETSLNEIKTKGAYKNLTYDHAGPAHLSIGQEAAAVGMAFGLGPEDHIFGSHRSHGEILAKGFSAIRKLSEEQLLSIMRTYRDGALLRPVEKGYRGNVHGLAVRFFTGMNNFCGRGGQTLGETMGIDAIARIGAGVNPEQMHAERVNGYDPLPVIDAFRRKKQTLLEGRGPVLLDTVTYRISGHSPSDASSYRSKEEIERWQQADSIRALRARLIESRVVTEDALDTAKTCIEAAIFDVFRLATDLEASTRV